MNDREKAQTSYVGDAPAAPRSAADAKAWLDRGTSPGQGYGRAGICAIAGHAYEGTFSITRFDDDGRPVAVSLVGKCPRCLAKLTTVVSNFGSL